MVVLGAPNDRGVRPSRQGVASYLAPSLLGNIRRFVPNRTDDNKHEGEHMHISKFVLGTSLSFILITAGVASAGDNAVQKEGNALEAKGNALEKKAVREKKAAEKNAATAEAKQDKGEQLEKEGKSLTKNAEKNPETLAEGARLERAGAVEKAEGEKLEKSAKAQKDHAKKTQKAAAEMEKSGAKIEKAGTDMGKK